MFFCMVLALITIIVNPAYATKPPWSGGSGGPKDQPPAAPEPLSLTLIAMGGSAAVGYYLGRKKKK